MRTWYARLAVVAALVVGVGELVLAGQGAIALVRWATGARDPSEAAVAGYVEMVLAAPIFALVTLAWFTLFAARAAWRGIEDGYLGTAAALALSLGVVHFAAPPPWLAGALTIVVVGAALGAVAAWRCALARR